MAMESSSYSKYCAHNIGQATNSDLRSEVILDNSGDETNNDFQLLSKDQLEFSRIVEEVYHQVHLTFEDEHEFLQHLIKSYLRLKSATENMLNNKKIITDETFQRNMKEADLIVKIMETAVLQLPELKFPLTTTDQLKEDELINTLLQENGYTFNDEDDEDDEGTKLRDNAVAFCDGYIQTLTQELEIAIQQSIKTATTVLSNLLQLFSQNSRVGGTREYWTERVHIVHKSLLSDEIAFFKKLFPEFADKNLDYLLASLKRKTQPIVDNWISGLAGLHE
eukprot:148896_1